MSEEALLEFPQAMELLGVSRPTLYRWIRDRKVKAFKAGKQWRFRRRDLAELLQESSVMTESANAELEALSTALRVLAPGGVDAWPAGLDDGVHVLVHQLFETGVRAGASDVHLDPEAGGGCRVKLRVAGRLTEVGGLGADAAERVVEALMSEAGATLHDAGRFGVDVDERTVDVRCTVLDTVRGPKLCMRIFDRSTLRVDPDAVFPRPADRAVFEALTALPFGLVLVSGPGGSGKTTTAYSVLHAFAERGMSVYGIEAPVEVLLDGVVQLQLPPGSSDASEPLRQVLDADPDVIFLAAADGPAAALACKAALGGHVVIVQVQARSAADALDAFVRTVGDAGMVSSCLAAVTCQVLVRKLCLDCATDGEAGAGCDACVRGYRGRAPAYELLLPDGAQLDALAGGQSLATDGLAPAVQALVGAGVTTAEELHRVVRG